MSKARELLKRFMHELTKEELCSVPDELQAEIEELLDQPEEGVYQKLLRIEDGVEVEILPSELWQDGYEAGKRSALISKQPEQEPVAWMNEWVDEVGEPVKSVVYNFYDDANLIPLYTAPPKREPLGLEIMDVCGSEDYREGFKDGALYAEKAHGIGGGE